MSEINPISRLYNDMIKILNTMVIKYSVKAEQYETIDTKSDADRYLSAFMGKDTFFSYSDYTEDEIRQCIPKEDFFQETEGHPYTEEWNYQIELFLMDKKMIPEKYRNSLRKLRRERLLREYEEPNNYYRMLNGLPDIEDTNYICINDILNSSGNPLYSELLSNYPEFYNVPIHKIESELGTSYISLLETEGVIDNIKKIYPDKKYLNFLGSKKISIYRARTAKNFSILQIDSSEIMESTYRQFIDSYEKARLYFISNIYTYQYRTIIDYYDNFIALCIFVMAIQQLSARSIQNAVDREFYDIYSVQLLYETYGVPFNDKLDETTQKQIVQNLNLLIQNKATDKVILDIASILGFTNAKVYEYMLVKKRLFDDKGRPIIKKINKFNQVKGEMEEVYDYENMYDLYFQRVDIGQSGRYQSMQNSLNRVEYEELTRYDPFWWEDDDLYKEIWEKNYNYLETKYLGVTVPYRMTETVFQSVIFIQMIFSCYKELSDLTLTLPKISDVPVNIVDTLITFCALMCKKYGIPGTILIEPSKLLHVVETIDRDIDKEIDEDIEILGFDFKAFDTVNLDETFDYLKEVLVKRTYKDNPEYDILTKSPLYDYDDDTSLWDGAVDSFCKYASKLKKPSSEVSNKEKIEAINKIYENLKLLYNFISYNMSKTNDKKEYYALKKLYDVAFYIEQTHDTFMVSQDGKEFMPKTYLEYLKYKNSELYNFVNNVEKDEAYIYIDHIIYRLELLDKEINISQLYIINDEYSQLMIVFRQLIEFFKSFTCDLVGLSSYMIMDFRITNMLKLIDEVSHISSRIRPKDRMLMLLYGDIISHMGKIISPNDKLTLNDTASVLYKRYVLCKPEYENALKVVETDDESIKNDQSISINSLFKDGKSFVVVKNDDGTYSSINNVNIENTYVYEDFILNEIIINT